MELKVELPKHEIGTKFIHKAGKQTNEAEVIGYQIVHNTDTNKTNVMYRIRYNFAGLQDITATVARSTVDIGIIKQEKEAQQ